MGPVLFELLPCLLGGMLLGWKWPALPGWLAPPLVRWGVPLSVAALLLRSTLSFSLLKVALVAFVVPLLSLAVLLNLSPLRHRLRDPALILGAVVGNTGYWGLPVALAFLPQPAIAAAVVYDVAGTLFTWSAGPLMLPDPQLDHTRRISTQLASPAMKGLLLSLVIHLSPWKGALAGVLWWPARAVLVIALGLLGMRLGLTLRHRTFHLPLGLPYALAIKLLLIPVLVGVLGTALALPPLDRQALVLQGAAPTALSVLLMAEAHQDSAPAASTLVITSTLAAMVTVPLWWAFMQ
jgi:predicted permease